MKNLEDYLLDISQFTAHDLLSRDYQAVSLRLTRKQVEGLDALAHEADLSRNYVAMFLIGHALNDPVIQRFIGHSDYDPKQLNKLPCPNRSMEIRNKLKEKSDADS